MAVEGVADVQTDTLGATGVQAPAPTLWKRPGFKPRRRLESELSGSQQVDKHVTAAMYVWPSIEGPPSWAQQIGGALLMLSLFCLGT